jgi:hypothetical protein
MNRRSSSRIFLPALAVGLAFTSPGPWDKPAFQPSPGTILTKEFTTEFDVSLDDLSLTVNGQDIAEMIGQLEFTIGSEGKIGVTDTYKAIADGRPTELLRTFDSLRSMTRMELSPGQIPEPEVTGKSELEGKTVRFQWNEEEQSYDCTFGDDKGDETLLEGLREDMDYRVFLPKADVKVDDEWNVVLTDLGDVMMPGGNLRVLPEGMKADEETMRVLEDLMARFGDKSEELLDGTCVCTYKGEHDEDGTRVAEIALEIEVNASLDMSEFLNTAIQDAIEKSGAGEAVQFNLDTADFDLDFSGSGTLLWNVGVGRAHSFQASGDLTIHFDLVVGIEAKGESQDMEASAELSGTLRQSALVKE